MLGSGETGSAEREVADRDARSDDSGNGRVKFLLGGWAGDLEIWNRGQEFRLGRKATGEGACGSCEGNSCVAGGGDGTSAGSSTRC